MSMISSMLLGRKQPPPPPPPPSPHQHLQPGQKTTTANGGGGEAVEPPLSIDILEQPPSVFTDAGGLSLAAVLGCLGGGGMSSSPANMDWKETATAHVFMADVPGLRKEDVKVEVGEEKLLRISGQRAARAVDVKGDRWHRVERGERFSRTVRLPPNASTDGAGVHATLDNGVLTVTIPKDDSRKAFGRIIPITN
ncbi:18.9 kDa heat shock protein [Brachypodium distachyon]|uniref:SHSP domain-containing protein n=1 Tax=Brachypodium distachyon TaxID=15368 RepID=A0A0Q3HI32_BRADI|nr:18.9 kDa heat shock protein [Brachypodium distachyon]KQJ93090.1 hypothetical protein BRADI_3g02710v3 [Brachypodium distachyon]|eukprot:XP_003573937.1 18.9 kDa heat shock protein [Brachypodium distachyon]